MTYHPVPLEQKEVAIQRLVLILPIEEQEVNKPVSDAPGVIKLCSPFPFVGYRAKYTPLQSIKKASHQLIKMTFLQPIKKTFPPSLRKTFCQKMTKCSPCPFVGYRDKKTPLLYVHTSPSPFVGHRKKQETLHLVR